MKELRGSASAGVEATPDRALALLEDVAAYPRWYGEIVRSVTVVDYDGEGRPRRAQATLHVAVGPLTREFQLLLDVIRAPQSVRLTRVPHEPTDKERFDVHWQVSGAPTRIELSLSAVLDVPRLVPLGGVGETMATGFVSAAARALSP